jgi:hypothetical protein
LVEATIEWNADDVVCQGLAAASWLFRPGYAQHASTSSVSESFFDPDLEHSLLRQVDIGYLDDLRGPD